MVVTLEQFKMSQKRELDAYRRRLRSDDASVRETAVQEAFDNLRGAGIIDESGRITSFYLLDGEAHDTSD